MLGIDPSGTPLAKGLKVDSVVITALWDRQFSQVLAHHTLLSSPYVITFTVGMLLQIYPMPLTQVNCILMCFWQMEWLKLPSWWMTFEKPPLLILLLCQHTAQTLLPYQETHSSVLVKHARKFLAIKSYSAKEQRRRLSSLWPIKWGLGTKSSEKSRKKKNDIHTIRECKKGNNFVIGIVRICSSTRIFKDFFLRRF